MRSMTGFGRARVKVPGGFLTAEIRSINSRFLEVKIGLPREYQSLEPDLRKRVAEWQERGRVDIAIRRDALENKGRSVEVDLPLARESVKAWKRLQKSLGLPGEIDLAMLRRTSPDVVRMREHAVAGKSEEAALRKVLDQALKAHDRERRREGAHLAADMRGRLQALEKLRRQMRDIAARMAPIFQERLAKRLRKVLGNQVPEPDRLVSEVAMALDKADVTEEMTRLEAHLQAFRALTREKAASGKRMEFLLQEILREVNTTGSKANHLPLTQCVLEAKAELEKLREQAANVE